MLHIRVNFILLWLPYQNPQFVESGQLDSLEFLPYLLRCCCQISNDYCQRICVTVCMQMVLHYICCRIILSDLNPKNSILFLWFGQFYIRSGFVYTICVHIVCRRKILSLHFLCDKSWKLKIYWKLMIRIKKSYHRRFICRVSVGWIFEQEFAW